jgi:hypothetical protein
MISSSVDRFFTDSSPYFFRCNDPMEKTTPTTFHVVANHNSHTSSLTLRQYRSTLSPPEFIKSKEAVYAWQDKMTGQGQSQKVYTTNAFNAELCQALIDAAVETAKNRVNDEARAFCRKSCRVNVTQEDGWTKNRHVFFPTTDIPLEYIQDKQIVSAVNKQVSCLISQASQVYAIEESRITIDDAFVVKYSCQESGGQRKLAEHQDGSELTFNILLSNKSDFMGGGTRLTTNFHKDFCLERGQMLCHAGKQKHLGLEITSGERYLLVIFLKVSNTATYPPMGCCLLQ